VAEGLLVLALPDSTSRGVLVTSLLVSTDDVRAQWYFTRGHRTDLLDDGLLQQRVRFEWLRYDGGIRRYIVGQVTLLPSEAAGSLPRPAATPTPGPGPVESAGGHRGLLRPGLGGSGADLGNDQGQTQPSGAGWRRMPAMKAVTVTSATTAPARLEPGPHPGW
jgi:hypothetical protein